MIQFFNGSNVCDSSPTLQYDDRISPMDKHVEVMINKHGLAAAPITPQMFGNAGKEHMEKYGEIYLFA